MEKFFNPKIEKIEIDFENDLVKSQIVVGIYSLCPRHFLPKWYILRL